MRRTRLPPEKENEIIEKYTHGASVRELEAAGYNRKTIYRVLQRNNVRKTWNRMAPERDQSFTVSYLIRSTIKALEDQRDEINDAITSLKSILNTNKQAIRGTLSQTFSDLGYSEAKEDESQELEEK